MATTNKNDPLTGEPIESKRNRRRRRAWLIAQGCVTAGLLAYLVLKVDVEDAVSSALGASPLILAAAVLQLSLQLPLIAWRWTVIVASLGGRLPFRTALRFVWIGAFFSQVLPGSVGGDVVRMWLYWSQYGSRRIAVYSVTIERLLMVVVLLLLVLTVQPGLAALGAPLDVVATTSGILAAIAIALALLIFFGRALAAHGRWLALRALAYAASDVRGLLSDVPRTVLLCALSVASYLNMATSMWLIAVALRSELAFVDSVVVTPLIVLAAALPFSVGGWGIRETAALVLFGLVGLAQGEALALSVLFGLSGIVVTLPGAWLWFVRSRGGSLADISMRQPPIQ